jgi:hypothetical protein
MRRTNCWFYALPKWFRGERKYLIVRWSHHLPWIPHVMLADDISQVDVEEVIPEKPRSGWRGYLTSPLFKARVRKGKGT